MDIKKSHDHIGYGNGILDCGEVQGTALSVDFPEWGSGPRQVPGPYGTQGLKGDRVGRFTKPVIQNGTMRTLIPYYSRGPNLSIVERYYDHDDLKHKDHKHDHMVESFWDKRMDVRETEAFKKKHAKEHPKYGKEKENMTPGKEDPFASKKEEYNYALQYKVEEASHSGSSTKSEYAWKKNYYGSAGYERQFGQPQFRGGISQKSNMHGGGCMVKRGFIPYSSYVEETPTIHAHA